MKNDIDDLFAAARNEVVSAPGGNFEARLTGRLRRERAEARTERIESRCAIAVFALLSLGSVFWLVKMPAGESTAAGHEEIAAADLINGDYYVIQLAATGDMP